MKNTYRITIPEPCHEDWNKMTPDETGRFCSSCAKSVVDFSGMKTKEIQQFFIKNQGKSVCGHFRNEQLDSIIIQIPSQILHTPMHFHKMFMLVLLITMGTSLLSCKDNNGNSTKIDKVEVINSTNTTNITKGKPMPAKPITTKNDTLSSMTDGMICVIPDSLKNKKSESKRNK